MALALDLAAYLPQVYVESDMDATNCYLFFQHLVAKVDLINSVIAQAHNLPESLNGLVSDVLVGICKVGWVYAWLVSWHSRC